jgi:hypothetical protein
VMPLNIVVLTSSSNRSCFAMMFFLLNYSE